MKSQMLSYLDRKPTRSKNVYTITLIYNTKLGVYMYGLKVMYTRIFFYFDFFINDGNSRKYPHLLSWSLSTRNPNFRFSHLFSRFFTFFTSFFYVFCSDLIDFSPNSRVYISILIHGFNRGRGELRLGGFQAG